MPAQDFGDDLRSYRGTTTHAILASCLLSHPAFASRANGRAADLEQSIRDIEAGSRWPFNRDDLIPFVEAVVACVRRRSVSLEYQLIASAAVYFCELGP